MGIMEAEHVDLKIQSKRGNSHYPNGSLVCLENTSNRGGGTCYKQNEIDSITKVSRIADVMFTWTVLRLFNASVSTGIKVSDMVKDCDTVSICLSKGLGAPVGSVLAGSVSALKSSQMEKNVRWGNETGWNFSSSRIICSVEKIYFGLRMII